jgi:hypothetical protein
MDIERKGGFGIVSPGGTNYEKIRKDFRIMNSQGTNYEKIRRVFGSMEFDDGLGSWRFPG